MKKQEKMAVKVCDCGATNPHVYFFADPEIEQSRLPVPFSSIEAVEKFLDEHLKRNLISAEQKETMMKVVREANLGEKMDLEEELFLTIYAFL